MVVIATTPDGYIIQATALEVKEILTAVTGTLLTGVVVGQKIPALDYASTIRKLQSLKNDNSYVNMMSHFRDLHNKIKSFEDQINNASQIAT